MRNLKYVFIGIGLIGSLSVYGQEGNSVEVSQDKKIIKKTQKSPTEKALRQTDKMKEELGLTEEQYQKVYELNVKVNMKIEAIRKDETLTDEQKRDFVAGNKMDRENVLNSILTAEQQQKRAELKAAKKEAHNQKQENNSEE